MQKILKHILLITIACVATGANAQVYKCKGADGKIQFSDKPCIGAKQTELVPDRGSYVSPEQQYEAQQRTARMRDEINAQEQEVSAANAARHAEYKHEQAVSAQKSARTQAADNSADAVANCVRDVERRGASQNVKAEMIASCRTAGSSQRATGTPSSAVSDCVKNVERTGASEREKARQIALCHGGDVQPEVYRPAHPVALNPAPQAVIKSCNGPSCSDQFGNRYTTTQGKTVRSDGKRCHQQGTRLYCDE